MDETGMIMAFGDGATGYGDGGTTATFTAPGPSFDLNGFLSTATGAIGTIAKTAGEFQLARERIASANEQAAFNRWAGQQELDLRRTQITNAGNIEKIKAAAELQRAAYSANNSGVLQRVFGGEPGNYSGIIALAAVAAAVIAFMQYKGKK